MVNVLTRKQAGTGFSILDAVGISLAQNIVVDGIAQPILNTVTGGNVFFNALGKVGGAVATNQLARGQIGSILSTAMIISAGNDLIQPFVGGRRSNGANLNTRQGGSDTFGSSNVTTPNLTTL